MTFFVTVSVCLRTPNFPINPPRLTPGVIFRNFPNIMLTIPTNRPAGMQTTDNTGKVLTKRVPGKRGILALTYSADDVERLRHLASHITIKGDKHPTMSLLARFGLALIADMHRMDPEGLAARLSRMVTPVPTGKTKPTDLQGACAAQISVASATPQ